jgi:hypothetical protein
MVFLHIRAIGALERRDCEWIHRRREFRSIGTDRRRPQGVSAPLSRGFEDAGARRSWDDSIWRLYVGMMSFSKTSMGGKIRSIHEPEREDVRKKNQAIKVSVS